MAGVRAASRTLLAWRKPRALALRLWHDRSGGPAIEFALVMPAFIALLLGILHIALIYLAQEGLQTAVEAGSRLIMTGNAQTAQIGSGNSAYTGMTASDFKNAVCSGMTARDVNGNSVTYAASLPPFLQCSRLYVSVRVMPTNCTNPTVTSPTFTYNASGQVTSTNTNYGTSDCAGTSTNNDGLSGSQGNLVIVQLIYLWPTVTAPFGLSLVNQTGNNRMLVATAAITVESYACATGSTSC